MVPLASLIRPQTLDDFLGQKHLVGKEGAIKKMIEHQEVSSMIFWGPPASGKTTLARIITQVIDAEFVELSAVLEGKAKLKIIVDQAQKDKQYGKKTIVFVDEIHRWNKSQQDALLPYVENGDIILLGATTENPSFSIVAPLLSRTRVFVFESHTQEDIVKALHRGIIVLQEQSKKTIEYDEDSVRYLAQISNGDMRFALNTLQLLVQTHSIITQKTIEAAANTFLRYDKSGEEHYNLISAVHKSLRSSNPTAGVYWITRMLEAGEDPLYIARRLVRFASEDVGNASPTSLLLANAVYDTCKNIGMPECGVALVQLAEYLARAPKNNSAYRAYQKAVSDVRTHGNLAVPLHLRNAPTQLMKKLEYGKGYEYDHDLKGKKSEQQTMPDLLKDTNYFDETI